MIRKTIAAALAAAGLALGILPAAESAPTATIAGYTVTVVPPFVLGGNANTKAYVTAPAGPGGRLYLRVYRQGALAHSDVFVIPAHKAGTFTAATGVGVCAPLGPRVTLTAWAKITIRGKGSAIAQRSAKRIC
jgi:hypothetical protein